ncbi:hypothetical protein AAFF_G00037750 [Aldrovandia affinis]|uniref:Uncharacterized protein n=1 Tax=Aldrovandia affinis TaxID=143900 RepID=A0AAD7T5W4_9TELE|nr:hypothetical protein AAFF_G00037750 [Aldrovandia affinis]
MPPSSLSLASSTFDLKTTLILRAESAQRSGSDCTKFLDLSLQSKEKKIDFNVELVCSVEGSPSPIGQGEDGEARRVDGER